MDDYKDNKDTSNLILSEKTYDITGAAMEVYYKLGGGILEPVYQQAMAIELAQRVIPFEQQRRFKIEYKGTFLDKEYIADFFCFDQVVVEIKAINQLSPVDWSQGINYLKVSKMRVGLLFNFGSVGKLEWKRLVI